MSYGVGTALLGLAVLSSAATAASLAKPHIVVILADDLGWNDVSFHGSDQIPTPNIDALAYNGVILNNHYTPALCTPSRAALMTGKYPIHTGMQHLVILEPEPWGLSLSERLLPQHLQKAGYRTHAVGKWHLGFYRKEYTPTFRGFDTHFGYWQGFQDYFNHSVRATFEPTMDGYDMRRGLNVDWGSRGKYSTEVFTDEGVRLIREHDASAGPMFLYLAHLAPHTGNIREPFQAPDEAIARFTHIQDPERRVYAAMVSKLDESVGEVVAALRAKGMLDNSIIVFMSDNGAPTHGIHSNRGSNYPLRGIKDTPWEGGQRTVAAIWSPLLHRRQRVSNHLMYMADWLPTLYSAAGLDVADLGNIDGRNMWPSISDDIPSPRTDLVYNIDDVGQEYAAIRKDDWKYITGSVGQGHKELWYGENGRKDSMGYNIHQVLSSRTATTLAGFTTKQQIQEKVSYINVANERSQWRLLNRKIILRLRESAELICTKSNATSIPINDCHPLEAPCLFNIRDDPCEYVNLASSHPLVVHSLEESLARYRKGVVKARNKPAEASANPIFWNNTWSCWHDEIDRAALELYPRSNILLLAVSILFIITAFVSLLVLMLRYPLHLAALPQSTKIISIFMISGTEEELNTKKKTVH